MVRLGYVLSSEEHSPRRLVELAAQAEHAGFEVGLISDHYVPWTETQGESSFVWGALGAISAVTRTLIVGTGVSCPTMRMHPAIIAQAAATTEMLMPGRFFLGLGTGERLNEHILGQRWPPIGARVAMLDEAVELIRTLWRGETVSHEGKYFRVEDAKLYSLPAKPPPLYIAVSGPSGARRAGELADGLIGTTPDRETLDAFEETGNRGRKLARLSVCYAATEAEATETALRYWPNGAINGAFMLELALPSDIEAVAAYLRPEDVRSTVVCGPDPRKHIERIEAFVHAGFDDVCIHQAGPAQDEFFDFYSREVIPHVSASGVSA
jgi:G6PDH family F420-dependent oxidoreductase